MADARPTGGRVEATTEAPAVGERTIELARLGGVRIEQILSGRLDAPVDYSEPVDEWVLVLAGHAALEVDGVPTTLDAGDWLLLPAGTAHRLVRTEPGTSWLTVTAREA